MPMTKLSPVPWIFFRFVGLCCCLLLIELLPRAEAFVGIGHSSSSNGSVHRRKIHRSLSSTNSMSAFAFRTTRLPAVVGNNPGGAKSSSSSSSNSSNNKKSADDSSSSDHSKFFWDFQGHSCYAEIVRPSRDIEQSSSDSNSNSNKPTVILVHGFACSTVYWRQTRDYLAREGYTIHLVDLLGQGKSAKPGRDENVVYSIDLWAQMVEEYARNYVELDGDGDGDGGSSSSSSSGVVLVGNSLGSLVALSAVTGDWFRNQGNSNDDDDDDDDDDDSTDSRDTAPSGEHGFLTSSVRGLCLFNCGVGLNTKNVIKVASNPQWLKTFLVALFAVLDVLVFGNKPLLTYVLDRGVSKETIRNALTALYAYGPDRVDDELVDSFLDPVIKDETSSVVEVLSQIYTNDAGRTPMDLHERYWNGGAPPVPIHLIWGDRDAVTPIYGDVGRFYSDLALSREAPNVSMQVIENAGHVPFDERPECNEGLIEWLETNF